MDPDDPGDCWRVGNRVLIGRGILHGSDVRSEPSAWDSSEVGGDTRQRGALVDQRTPLEQAQIERTEIGYARIPAIDSVRSKSTGMRWRRVLVGTGPNPFLPT